MTDVVDALTRSRMMSGIRGRDTLPELTVRRALHSAGLRYRVDVRSLPGRPDIVFPSRLVAIFVHGCFWHRHQGCRFATTPATRPEFWQTKFAQNVARDERVRRQLEAAGWAVVTVWECETRDYSAVNRLVALIKSLPKRTLSNRDWRQTRGAAKARLGP